MVTPEIQTALENAAHEVLIWVGFGTLVGLAGKALMPGRDPGGAVATLMTGIAGCIIGCGTLMFFTNGTRITPVSLPGFFCGTGGAFVLLFFYRLLSGSLLLEAEAGESWTHKLRRKRRRTEIARDI
jgi:uncharacterized membrane protein YeaQ/YmgE (transglycosylase-associated protein family)